MKENVQEQEEKGKEPVVEEVKVEIKEEEKVDEREAELLQQLSDMGFVNREVNVMLLRKYDYDILATVNALFDL